MPNKSSKAGHLPQRTCVICRRKTDKTELLRFVIVSQEPVFDLTGSFAARGCYVCDQNPCLEKIDKWVMKKSIKSRGR